MNLLIKPASGLCNMRCSYCFYADEMGNRTQKSYGIMSLDTLEAVVKKALEYSLSHGFLELSFQGGEPTLAGLDFFRAPTAWCRWLTLQGKETASNSC